MRALLSALAVALAACTPSPRADVPTTSEPIPAPGASTTPRNTRALLPAADEALPMEPTALADELRRTDRAVRSDVERWVRRGTPRATPLARAVSLRALHLQRLYRLLARRDRVARRVLPALPSALRRHARANIRAAAQLFSLVGPPTKKPPRFRYARPAPPRTLMRFYRKAERRFGVPWHVLAALNFVESKFGRVLGPSSAGALGPMQFLPSTWQAYGGGGDILDPHDSIMGAARYLQASGAPTAMRAALFAYNPTEAYVEAISIYDREIVRDVRNFYIYYFWHVFVTTDKGDVRLTGPGTGRG